MLPYLVATSPIDIAGDVNYDLLEVLENKRLGIFTDHAQVINKTTYISSLLIDRVYIKKAWKHLKISDY